jgi:putative ABC transport system ATP-binding protein
MNANGIAVSVSSLTKVFQVGDLTLEILKDAELEVGKGEFTAISGPSGSGKTTLLNIISGIDKPTKGRIVVFDEELSSKDEGFLANFRCNNVGFVFQSYNLISSLTVAENVAFPMEWLRRPEDYIRTRVDELLKLVDLEHRAEHFPSQLSGGEQQRVAFARALANEPPLVLADEPTGNLDSKTGLKIVEILKELRDQEKTVVVTTHDERILKLADQTLRLEDGKLMVYNE